MLVNGKWTTDWQPVQATDGKGGFIRETSSFRNWVTPDGRPGPTGSGGFKAAPGRYHLYAALICPWATRALIARKLKRLEDVVDVSTVNPKLSDQGWRFGDHPGATLDLVNGAEFMHELYTRADPQYTGRATVPVLWDKATGTIVNNGSAEIVRMFNSGFGEFADSSVDLYPEPLRSEIDGWNKRLYHRLNNGVYRAGFATTQAAYEAAFHDVFATLDEAEAHLAARRFVAGESVTEADIRLIVTLVRFDLAYHALFKCNLKCIADYPALSSYVKRLVAIPSIRDTLDPDHIKQAYYSIKALNPTGIVPLGLAANL